MPVELSLEVIQEREKLKSLKEMLHRFSAPAAEELIRAEGGRGGAMFCLRASVFG
jgi:hypothetical protein